MSDKPPDDDLLTFIAATVESMRDQMVTKDEFVPLREQVEYLGGQLESMREQVATKGDIARLESKLEVGVTTVRNNLKPILLRLDSIERSLSAPFGHIEAKLSKSL